MGESDNTMPFPFVTVRTANVGRQTTEVPRVDPETDQSADSAISADSAVTVWRNWQDALNLTERRCREQQRLERKLAETVGFPCATVLQANGESVTLHSLKEIRELLGVDSSGAAVRSKAEADFAAHQARWDAADRAIGYSAALRAEREAADRAEELLEVLSGTPATTLAGVAAKLNAVLKEGQPSENDTEFPWPQIRSTVEDIARISLQRAPS